MKAKTLSDFLYCINGSGYSEQANAVRKELGFNYLDLTNEELALAQSSGMPLLNFCDTIDTICEYLRENPEDAKHIEADTKRTILHRVIKLMAEEMNYKGPLPANHKNLLDALIKAFPEAAEKKDSSGKYPADYTHMVIAAYGHKREPNYFIGEELATNLLEYLISKGCKHSLQSIKDRIEKSGVSGHGYRGVFFRAENRRDIELMLEEYRKILDSGPQ